MPGLAGVILGTELGSKQDLESPVGEGRRGFLLGGSYPQMAQMSDDWGTTEDRKGQGAIESSTGGAGVLRADP